MKYTMFNINETKTSWGDLCFRLCRVGRQADKQTDTDTDRQAGRKADRQTDRQTHRQAGRLGGVGLFCLYAADRMTRAEPPRVRWVDTEKIRKGRISEDLIDNWRVFGGILCKIPSKHPRQKNKQR